MKYLVLFLLLPLFSIAQDASDIVTWDRETIDLGAVTKGDKVSEIFVFTNVSESDVEIDIVNTCVCTEAKWPQYPIEPGESAKIEFIFDTDEKDNEHPVEIDVYFANIDPDTGNPYSTFLNYTFTWKE
jgi:hypothetical protein